MHTVCFVAGQSGGHLLPALHLAKKSIAENPTTKILFITTHSSLDKEIVAKYSFINYTRHLSLSSTAQRSLGGYIKFFYTFLYSFFVSLYTLVRIKPKKIVSTGGSLALPVCCAGFLLRIPIELVELNAVPGKTTRFLAPLASTISLCFQETQKYFKKKCYVIAYPLRFSKSSITNSEKARKHLGLDGHKKTIFILGGSQGSLFINNAVKQWIETTHYDLKNIQIIHQLGKNDRFDWNGFYATRKINHITFSFLDQIDYCYNAADLIICRSGAGTLFEIDFFNKPCITIPLETAHTLHQVDNAHAFKALRKNVFTILHQNDIVKNNSLFEKTVLRNINII